jgi:hypothetical protein
MLEINRFFSRRQPLDERDRWERCSPVLSRRDVVERLSV